MRPDSLRGQTRLDRACEEAVNAKRCIGALRYLWRNSPQGAHDVSVQEMKQCLEASPVQRARDPNALLSQGEEEGEGDAEGDGEGDAEGDGEGVGEGEGEGVGEGDGSDVEMDESADESDASSLRAPTLRLEDVKEDSDPGEEPQPLAAKPAWDPEVDSPMPGSDGELPDSQRPGAWMGKFYRDHRTLGDPSPARDAESVGDSEDKNDGPDDASVAETDHDGDSLSGDSPFMDGWISDIIDKVGLREYLTYCRMCIYIYICIHICIYGCHYTHVYIRTYM